MTLPPLPEWAPHEAVWIGFPSDPELWLSDLKEAEKEVAAFAKAVHAGGKGEQVWLVAAHDDAAKKARQLAPFATVIVEKFGDIWLRDSGPIVMGSGKQRRAQGFRFNGWGNKYDLEGDQDVGERIAKAASLPYAQADWVLEGGAIDGDGSGTVVTTEQCLLNPNRNPGATHEDIEGRLEHDLGFERVIWLGDGPAQRPHRRPCRQSRALRCARPRRDPHRREGRPQRCRLSGCREAPECGKAGRRHSALARPHRERGRRRHPGELHELLHRQCRGRCPAVWRSERSTLPWTSSRRCSRAALQSGYALTMC